MEVIQTKYHEAWKSVENDYDKVRQQYMEVWGKKKKLMIILFILAILPGLFYYVFFYGTRTNKLRRSTLANNILKSAIEHLRTNLDKNQYEIKFEYFDAQPYKVGLYRSTTTELLNKINYGKNIFDQLTRNGLLGWFRSVPNIKYGPNVVRRQAIIRCNASISIRHKNKVMDGYCFQYILEETKVESDGKKGTRTKTYRYVLFNGTYIFSNSTSLKYPSSLSIKDKKFGLYYDKNSTTPLSKPQFELPFPTFNKSFDVLVAEDNGPKLNLLIQPRIASYLETLKEAKYPFLINSVNNNSLALLFKTKGGASDYAFNIEKISKFFKTKENAMMMIDSELNYFGNMIDLTSYLEENDCIVENQIS